MPARGKLLSEEEQAQIRALHEAGHSNRQIARQLGRSPTCIGNYIRNPGAYRSARIVGRPRNLTAQDHRRIARMASNSTLSLNQIRASMGLAVSRMTISRSIRSNEHITREVMKKAPRLNAQHKNARLEFARRNMATSWDKVIFSDEKKFNLDGPDGYRYYWRDLRHDPLIHSKRNFGGAKLMVWGGFGSSGKLELAFPLCRMDSQEYQEVLEFHLLPFLRGARRRTHVFQHDNASVHVSRSTKEWLQRHGVAVMDWPACSPDCNPIENLWGIMARRVYLNNRQYNSVEELKAAILAVWESIDDTTITNLVQSMPNRMFELIRHSGGPIDY
ncbi:hypothetical protein V3C99_005379 [Haemonchus contortus]